MFHRISGCHALRMVVEQHLTKQIKGFISDELVVLGVDELLPRLAGLLADDIVVVAI